MPHHRRDAAMPVLRELEPLLEQVRAAGELDPSMPIAERRAQVHVGIDAQAAHMVPPTLIATVEYDLQRDDGERYAERLRAIHVPVTYVCWEGRLHGSLGLTRLVRPANDWQRNDSFLRKHLPPQAPSSSCAPRARRRREPPITRCRDGGVVGVLGGKVALVLGASPGIGAAVARAFAREGAVGSGGSTDWSR
jgi:hypothetical protein